MTSLRIPLLILLIGLPTSVIGQAPETTPQRWAIIATDAEMRPLADLLTVELSQWKEVEIVEREKIERVFDELNLNVSQAGEAKHVTQLGRLSQAAALVLIDCPQDSTFQSNAAKKHLRLRLVDTRTSVRLLDVTLPTADLATEVAAFRDELKRAGDKLAIAGERLRLVGVISIKSEEPGEQLKPFCRTLTTLVEVGLHSVPELIVVERSDLSRLIDESEVSGLELDFLSAARLLETGVRRADDGKGMEVTCRLVSPMGGESKTLRLSVGSDDVKDVRREIVSAVGRELAGYVPTERLAKPEVEAAVFERRREWLQGAYRLEESVEMAEAAFALDPTLDRLKAALQDYRSWRHVHTNSNKPMPPMEGYERLLKMYYERLLRPEPGNKADFVGAFRSYLNEPLKRGSSDDVYFRARFRDRAAETLEVTLEAQAKDPRRQFDTMLRKLEIAFELAGNERDYVICLPALIDELVATRERAKVAESASDPTYARFLSTLVAAVTRAERYALQAAYRKPPPGSNADDRAQLLECLTRHDELAVRAADLFRQILQPGEKGAKAAREVLDMAQTWQPHPAFASQFDRQFRDLPLHILRSNKQERAYLETLLTRAQIENNPSQLARASTLVTILFNHMPRDQQREIAEQIFTTLDSFEDQATTEPLRETIRKTLVTLRMLEPKPADSWLDNAPGLWQSYTTRPIKLVGNPQHSQMLQMYFDRREDARRRGGELLTVWSNSRGAGVLVERVNLSTAKATQVGPLIPGFPRAFRGVPLAVGPDAIYVATNAPGFTVLREGLLERYTEEDGAPSNDVWRMAWWRDRLYIAFADAFASFDPETKKFTLLASSLSVEPRNPIDGRGSFFILHLIPDERNECLWLSIQDNALPRSRHGFWRFEPDSNTYRKISGSTVYPYQTPSGFVLFRTDPAPWADVDGTSGELTVLPEYPKPPYGPGPFVKIGGHIITQEGFLFAPGEEPYRAKLERNWGKMLGVGPGFISHFDDRENTLWYVEPKAGDVSR